MDAASPPDADRLRHRDLSARAERRLAHRRAHGALPARARPQRRADPAAPARRGRLDADDELRTAGCAIPVYRELRFGLSRRRPARAPLPAHAARAGPPRDARARSPGRRSPRRARSAIPTTSDFRTNFHQYSRYYGLGAFATPVLGLLRRFHNLTERTFVPTARGGARARRRRLPQPDDRRPRRRHRALRAGAAQRRAAPRSGGPETAPVLLMVGRVAAEKNVELGLRAFERARRAPARTCAWSSSATARRGRASRRRIPRRASSASSAAPTWPRTTRRPTCSCSRACPTPSATSSWRRSLPALPVVSFAVAAAAEHVADGVSGRLVAPGDEAAFIAAVESLAAPAQPLAPMRAAALAAARRADLARGARALRGPPGRHRPCTRSAAVPHSRRGLSGSRSGSSASSGSRASARSRSGCTAPRRAPGSSASSTRSAASATAGSGMRSSSACRGPAAPIGPSASVRMIGVGIVNLVVYKIIKRWIARPRPYRTCPGIRACARSLDEFSFPSGHTLHSVAFSLILTVYYPMFALDRLAAHRAHRRLARRPRPALPERRHRRRADRRRSRRRSASTCSSALDVRATSPVAGIVVDQTCAVRRPARRMNSATVAGFLSSQRLLEDRSATSVARRRSRRRADAARGAAAGCRARRRRPPHSTPASWRAATRSTCCRRRSGSSPRVPSGRWTSWRSVAVYSNGRSTHRLARARAEQPRRRDEAGRAASRSARTTRCRRRCAPAPRRARATRTRPRRACSWLRRRPSSQPSRRAVVAVRAAVQRELVAAADALAEPGLERGASASRRGSAARRGASPARRRRRRAPRRAFAGRPPASTARRRAGRCRPCARIARRAHRGSASARAVARAAASAVAVRLARAGAGSGRAAGQDALPVARLGAAPRGARSLAAVAGEERVDRGGEGGARARAATRDSGAAAGELAEPFGVADDGGRAARHRLEHREAEGLLVAGMDEGVGAGQHRRELGASRRRRAGRRRARPRGGGAGPAPTASST